VNETGNGIGTVADDVSDLRTADEETIFTTPETTDVGMSVTDPGRRRDPGRDVEARGEGRARRTVIGHEGTENATEMSGRDRQMPDVTSPAEETVTAEM
jgi:hypothetical protein